MATRTMRTIGRAAIVAILLGLCPRGALAQSTAAAEALFNEGRRAMDAKDYDTACQRFHESNRLDPAVGTLLNLAVCETTRGHVATAWELFRATSEKLAHDDPRREYVTSQLGQIEPRLPRLTMRLAPGAPLDTKAKEGSTELSGAAFGVALPMDPGKHAFVIEAPGYEPRQIEVELVEGAKQDLEIAPGPVKPAATARETVAAPAAATAPAPDEGQKRGHDTRLIGWIAGGVGVAGLGVGLTTGIMALGKKSTTDEQCSDQLKRCSPVGSDAASSGRTLATVSTISWITGALGIGAGAYFILTSTPSSGSKTALGTQLYAGGGELQLRRTW